MDAKIARRTWLKSIGTGAAVLAAGRIWQDVLAQGPTSPAVIVPAPPTGPFTLPPLPYPPNALEPWIDTTTMEIHHGRHHAAYVNNLNKALVNYPDLQTMSVEDLLTGLAGLPETVRGAVQNNAGGHFNHSLFWQWMGPQAGGAPDGRLADLLATAFGSFDKFKEAMTAAALGRFGSGWAWLVQGTDGRLQVVSTANQDSPVTQGLKPLLGVDVWEHAYYLKYQNRRNEYLAAWWNVVDWKKVAQGLG